MLREEDELIGLILSNYKLKQNEKVTQYINKLKEVYPPFKQGYNGINSLIKDGYFYSSNQLKLLQEIFNKFK